MVQQSTPKQKRWGKQRPYYGTVVAIEGLCKIMSAEDKDTIRVEVHPPNALSKASALGSLSTMERQHEFFQCQVLQGTQQHIACCSHSSTKAIDKLIFLRLSYWVSSSGDVCNIREEVLGQFV